LREERSLLSDKTSLMSLRAPDPHRGPRMSNRTQTVKDLAGAVGRSRLVEGWIEGPCAEAADLRGINRLMLDFYDDPDFVRELMDLVVEIGISFGHAQIEAGAEIIGIGDAAASLIGLALYEEFVWPGEQRLVSAMHDAGVICRLHICGNNRRFLPSAARLGCEIIDIDAPVTMAAARQAVGVEQVLCGNLDPVRSIHEGTPDKIRAQFAACHADAGSRYIVGGGCEIPRGTSLDNFQAIVDFARLTSGS